MSTLPQNIAADLAPVLPGWTFQPWPASTPGNIPAGRIHVQLWRDQIGTVAGNPLQLNTTMTFRLMIGSTPSQATDADLAAALDILLDELHAEAHAATWGGWNARYAIFPNAAGTPTYPGYELTFDNIPSSNTYRQKKK